MKNYCMFDLGEGFIEGEVVFWWVFFGDIVKINDVLCEVEMVKLIVEFFSFFVGIVVKLCVEFGEMVVVGELLVIIDDGFDD